MKPGCFIVFEGLEGSGKSTCISFLENMLRSRGVEDIVRTREPGGTTLAEKLRSILLDPSEQVVPEAELLMMYASRVQLVQTVIRPSLERGAYVLGDRHDLSSMAYQGGGRGMDLEVIRSIRRAVLGDFRPDLTLLLDIDPEAGLDRVDSRGRGRDRFELEKLDFYRRIREVYLAEAAGDSSIAVIDASAPLEQVTGAVADRVEEYLCSRG